MRQYENETVDATEDVVIHVDQAAIDKADRKSPRACVLAIAALAEPVLKLRGIDYIHVFKSRAYVKYLDDQPAVRYSIGHATQKRLEYFDLGGDFPKGEYLFKAIPPSETAEVKRERRPRYNNTDRKHRWRAQPMFLHKRQTARVYANQTRRRNVSERT